jgi:hypothetical protein
LTQELKSSCAFRPARLTQKLGDVPGSEESFPRRLEQEPQWERTSREFELLDPIREAVMHSVRYRNFGSYETLVGNLSVDVGAERAGSAGSSCSRKGLSRRPTATTAGWEARRWIARASSALWMEAHRNAPGRTRPND